MAGKLYTQRPVAMRGAMLTAMHRAANAELIAYYVQICGQPLGAVEATNLLRELIGPDMPEGNMYRFVHMISRWLLRQGLHVTYMKKVRRPPQGVRSLHEDMCAMMGEAISPYALCSALKTNNPSCISFWQQPGYLDVALRFVGQTAGSFLVEGGWCTSSQALPFVSSPCVSVVQLLDMFVNREGARKDTPHQNNLAAFGAWVKEKSYARMGQGAVGRLAEALAPVTGWNITKNSTRDALIANVLAGRTGGWNLRTLDVLASFLGYRDVAALVAAYRAYEQVQKPVRRELLAA